MKTGLGFLILAVALFAVGKQKKPAGQILDPTALARVGSYCVDVRDLPESQADEVNGFVREESKPGKLLTKIPWKLYPDCREASADAVIKLQFPRMNVIGVPVGQALPPGQEPDQNPYRVKAVLTVLDAESSKTLYKNQADPLDPGTIENQVSTGDLPVIQRRNAMYGAFWTLAQDVPRVEQSKEH